MKRIFSLAPNMEAYNNPPFQFVEFALCPAELQTLLMTSTPVPLKDSPGGGMFKVCLSHSSTYAMGIPDYFPWSPLLHGGLMDTAVNDVILDHLRSNPGDLHACSMLWLTTFKFLAKVRGGFYTLGTQSGAWVVIRDETDAYRRRVTGKRGVYPVFVPYVKSPLDTGYWRDYCWPRTASFYLLTRRLATCVEGLPWVTEQDAERFDALMPEIWATVKGFTPVEPDPDPYEAVEAEDPAPQKVCGFADEDKVEFPKFLDPPRREFKPIFKDEIVRGKVIMRIPLPGEPTHHLWVKWTVAGIALVSMGIAASLYLLFR